MDEEYNKLMENMMYKMISFMPEIIRAEEDPVNRGKKIVQRSILLNEFSEMINKKNEQERKKQRENLSMFAPKYTPKIESDDEDSIFDIDIEIAKKPKKKVTINESQKGGSKNTKIKKLETMKQKINRKLNKLKADDVKKVGKEFNIKPEQGKRYLTKTHVIDKVNKNTKLYGKVLDHVNKKYRDLVKTESEHSIFEDEEE